MFSKSYKLFFILIVGLVSACSTKTSYHLPKTEEQSLSISSSEPDAVFAAQEIYQQGGNLADATVAASFAISVVRQQSTGIGGGGFLVARINGKNLALDFRERAPLRAHKTMFIKNGKAEKAKAQTGSLAVGVPGLVKGLFEFHQKYGRLRWNQVLQPAIRLAKEGTTVSKHLEYAIQDQRERILSDELLSRTFMPEGKPLRVGDRFFQPELATSLTGIAEQGPRFFYQGPIAQKLLVLMKQRDGILAKSDLDSYRVIRRAPLETSWKSWRLVSMPPPSSGGIHILQILQMTEEARRLVPMRPLEVLEIEAFKRAFSDRSLHLGDPSFSKVPTKKLLSKKYLLKRSKEIADENITASSQIFPMRLSEPDETTHLSLMDSDGNMVATTQSINGLFGSGVSIPGTGIVLNNTMDDFSIQPGVANQFGLIGGLANSIQSQKTPLSSMSPSLLYEEKGNRRLVIGAPGGSRIITNVYLGIRRFDQGLDPEEIMSACRFHHQWSPDKILLESSRCQREKKLFKASYTLEDFSGFFGELQMVGQLSDKKLFAAADPRGRGEGKIFNRPRLALP